MSLRRLVIAGIVGLLLAVPSRAQAPPAGVRRIVFLGDSITYSGQFIEFLEAWTRAKTPDLRVEFLNLGLPSETVSGLTEPGHAGGQFPRPDLRERLDRVLAKTKPDLVIACYGMNDGIYAPYSDERFGKFPEGMRFLRERATAAGARVLHLTPPPFDPRPILANTLPAGLDAYPRPYQGYDEVLNLDSAWLLAQRGNGWDVVDVHGPMKRLLDDRRRQDPTFRLAADGVHLDAAGHWLIAREILKHWGISPRELGDEPTPPEQALAQFPHGPEILDRVQKKQRILKDAWLTETGHNRPGMNRGLPLDDAQREADRLDNAIRKLLATTP